MSTRRPAGVAIAIAAALATALAAGCSSKYEEPFARYEPAGEGGDSAILEGELVYDDQMCVVVRQHGGPDVLPVLPRPAKWDEEAERIYFDGEDFLAIGTEVSLTGGYVDVAPEATIPSRCDEALDLFLVAQR